MFRRLSILAVTLGVLLFVGCGGGDSSESTTSAGSADPRDAVEADFISRTGFTGEDPGGANSALTSTDEVSSECGEIECRAQIVNGNGTTYVVARYSVADDGSVTLADYECVTEGSEYCDAIEASSSGS